MKRLARTNCKVLKQAYTGNIYPVKEYGAVTLGAACKSNTNKLRKVQNAGTCNITGGLKNNSHLHMETTIRLSSLDQRSKEKVLTHHAKLQRMPSHPAHQQLQCRTKENRLKSCSFNHTGRELVRSTAEILPNTPENHEPL